ncbi:hypothetical protein ANO14919_121750 [Xylariales sp. No.14919]|nr:hypothetical protein ANO14919_121750 [Xylariales sp. No.14919]
MTDLYDAEEAIPLRNDELDIDLYPPGSGELKTTVPDHLGTIYKTGYSIRFQRLCEVHGRWNSKKPDDASLLAIKMTPRIRSPGDHFKSLSVTMTLELSKGIKGNHEAPYFASYEPGQEGAYYTKEVSHSVTVTKEAEGNFGGQLPVGADIGLTLSKSKSEEFQRRLIHKIEATEESSSIGTSNRKRTNRITWTLTPAEQSDGIGDYMIIALLIQRSRSSKFRIKVESKADINIFKDSANSLLQWNRKITLGDFGPESAIDQLKLAGVDETNLERVSDASDAPDQNILRKIAFVHVPERVAPGSVYKIADRGATAVGTENPCRCPIHPTHHVHPRVGTRPNSDQISATAATPAKLVQNVQAVASSTADVQLAPGSAMGTFLATASPTVGGPAFSARPMRSDRSIPEAASSYSKINNRAVRHRRMAALYRRLAQLHMEEADDADSIPSLESYADEVEMQGYV